MNYNNWGSVFCREREEREKMVDIFTLLVLDRSSCAAKTHVLPFILLRVFNFGCGNAGHRGLQ